MYSVKRYNRFKNSTIINGQVMYLSKRDLLQKEEPEGFHEK